MAIFVLMSLLKSLHYGAERCGRDPIEELLQWESDKDMIAWLDNL
jgi:hypothetical protein